MYGVGVRRLVDVKEPRLVWLLSLTHGVNEFFSLLVPPLFPFLVPDLGIGYAEASLLVVIFFATYSIVQLPVGRIGDEYDPRMLLAAGMLVMAAGIGIVALAPTFPTMLLGMFVAGVGGSTYHPTGMSLISDVESTTTHGRSMGLHATFGTFGSVAAPVFVTAIAVTVDWRTGLLIASGLGAGYALVLLAAYPRGRAAGRTAPLRALPAALRVSTATLRRTARAGAAFVRTKPVLKLVLIFVIVGGQSRAVMVFIPAFASDAVGGDPAFGSAMLALTMVAAGLSTTLSGYGVDHVDRIRFGIASFVLAGLVIAGIALLPLGRVGLPVGFAVLVVVLFAVGPTKNAMAAGVSRRGRSASLFGVTMTASAIGGATGPYVLGVVADAVSLDAAFLVAAGFAPVGIVALYGARDLVRG